MSKNSTSYHHGDAKTALVEAGLALLQRDGAASISLRQVAERAGLSRQAPYNYFSSKEAMLAEFVRQGFTRLGKAIGEAGDAPDAEVLTEIAAAYIGFGQSEPALFRLMFSRELVDLATFPDAKAAADDAFMQLSRVVARIAGDADTNELSMACWCIVHGYTTLCVEARLETPDLRLARANTFARIIEADIASHRRTDRT